jgi:Sec-independent protein translocase protein TatA
MNQQFEQQESSINQTKINIWLIAITAVIAALIVGGSVYFLINRKSQNEINGFQSTIQNLNSQLDQSKKNLDSLNLKLSDLQNQQVQLQNNTQLSSNTENWEEYTDRDFKYYFKYPENWKIKTSSNLFDNIIMPNNQQSCGELVGKWTCLDSIYFGVIENKNGMEIKDFFTKELGWEEDFSFKNIREVKINNNNHTGIS